MAPEHVRITLHEAASSGRKRIVPYTRAKREKWRKRATKQFDSKGQQWSSPAFIKRTNAKYTFKCKRHQANSYDCVFTSSAPYHDSTLVINFAEIKPIFFCAVIGSTNKQRGDL